MLVQRPITGVAAFQLAQQASLALNGIRVLDARGRVLAEAAPTH